MTHLIPIIYLNLEVTLKSHYDSSFNCMGDVLNTRVSWIFNPESCISLWSYYYLYQVSTISFSECSIEAVAWPIRRVRLKIVSMTLIKLIGIWHAMMTYHLQENWKTVWNRFGESVLITRFISSIVSLVRLYSSNYMYLTFQLRSSLAPQNTNFWNKLIY